MYFMEYLYKKIYLKHPILFYKHQKTISAKKTMIVIFIVFWEIISFMFAYFLKSVFF
jgi:hypothetical protein